MSINKILVISRWEFVEKVRTKAFLISLVLTPILIVGFSVVPGLLATKPDTHVRNIGVIDKTGKIEPALAAALSSKYKLENGKPNYVVVDIEPGSGDRERANHMVISKAIDAYIVIDSSIFKTGKFEYLSENVSNFRETERIQSTVKDIVIAMELEKRGVNPDVVKEVSKPVDLVTVKLSKEGKEEKAEAGADFLLGYVFIFVLALLILTSGQILVRSVVEEKTNRIVEVLLSSTTADEIMSGKIIGLSLLGLTQLAIWAAMGVGFAGQLAPFVRVPDNFWWLIIFFILGYLFYASLFVMAGAPITTEQEAQQVTSYVSMALFLPMIISFMIVQNPNAGYVKLISLFPLFTPTMMALRIPVQSPETWELISGTAVLAVSTYLAMIAAGRIFRIGILVYGKRPSFSDLLRWAVKKG
ncbi:MAG: ABC transporter permease [Candidatus Kryptoniota bacterium]